jgi:hypothetical protein
MVQPVKIVTKTVKDSRGDKDVCTIAGTIISLFFSCFLSRMIISYHRF